MKLSVLMFCPQFRPIIGGAERQAEKLAAALAEGGCRVTILTPRLDSDSPSVEESNGVTIERYPYVDLSRRYPVPGIALFNIPFIIWQVVRAIRPRLKGAHVLHCHIAELQTAAAALAAYIAGVPVLCKVATAGERSDLGNIENTGSTGWLVARLTRAVIGTWVATTAAVMDALVRGGVKPDKIARIPNGVDIATGRTIRPFLNGASHFLYLGRLSENAGRDVPTLIRAFDRLAQKHSNLELAIVGGGDLFEETKRLAETCAARERIHMPGFDQPEKWLAWADCFVLPSRREGLSNALLEAMAAGLPCIANDIPPNREVLDGGNAGLLVPVEGCDALEAAMCDIVENQETVVTLAQKAIQRVESHYSIQSVASRYIVLYQSLIGVTTFLLNE